MVAGERGHRSGYAPQGAQLVGGGDGGAGDDVRADDVEGAGSGLRARIRQERAPAGHVRAGAGGGEVVGALQAGRLDRREVAGHHGGVGQLRQRGERVDTGDVDLPVFAVVVVALRPALGEALPPLRPAAGADPRGGGTMLDLPAGGAERGGGWADRTGG